MKGPQLLGRLTRGGIAAVAVLSFIGGGLPSVAAQQTVSDRPVLTARMTRWQVDPAKKRKGPQGFDIQFRLVGSRFDGSFGVEGVPQTVPAGEPFDAQVKLTNIGQKKIKLASITVTGESGVIPADLLVKKVAAKTSATVATFKVPAQPPNGSSFQILVILSNGDRHSSTLSFSKS
jgi:hypothetical protein